MRLRQRVPFLRNPTDIPVTWPANRVPACPGSGVPIAVADCWVICPTCGQRVHARRAFGDGASGRIIIHAVAV